MTLSRIPAYDLAGLRFDGLIIPAAGTPFGAVRRTLATAVLRIVDVTVPIVIYTVTTAWRDLRIGLVSVAHTGTAGVLWIVGLAV